VIIEVLKLASVISTSSIVQKRWFEEKMNLRNVVLIPNALDDRFLPHAKPFKMSKRIAWRGNESHINDLITYKDELRALLEKTPNHDWVFFGLNPHFLKTENKNYRWTKPAPLIDFVIEFCKFNPSFVFVPLADTFFNRVKSHLAFFDATLAGAVALGPNFEEWENIGTFKYQPQFFRQAFETMIGETENHLQKIHKLNFEFVKDNLLLSKVNKLRIELIENL
jgi:hypothetical protein